MIRRWCGFCGSPIWLMVSFAFQAGQRGESVFCDVVCLLTSDTRLLERVAIS